VKANSITRPIRNRNQPTIRFAAQRVGRAVLVRLSFDSWCGQTSRKTLHTDETNTIGEALKEYDSGPLKIARALAVDRGWVGMTLSLSWYLSKSQPPPDGATLTQALQILQTLKEDVVLIIDEAQQVLTTHNGMNAMFALKAARDGLNRENVSQACVLCSQNQSETSWVA
jgi:hypothetical protein